MADERKIIDVQITGLGDAVAEIQRLIKEVDTLDTKMSQLKTENKTNTKEYASLTAEMKMYRTQLSGVVRETAQAIKVTNEKAGYLEQLEQDVRALEKAYYRLSEAEFKGTQGKAILENLKKQRAALATAQAEYGKYSMNVGNYASATNMLAINVGQVMKEIPNFAISARIGIMSLTNNLPMLAEAIKAVRVQQQQMIAEGQKAPSMFSLISKSIFGLTGVMSILMVLLQVFGGRIIEWVGSLFQSEDALKANIKAMYELHTVTEMQHKTMKDGGGVYKTAVADIERLNTELKASVGNTDREKAALESFNKTLGIAFGEAENVAEALSKIEAMGDDYVNAMMKMAFANSFLAKAADDVVAIAEIQTKSQGDLVRNAGKNYSELYKQIQEFDRRIKKLDEAGQDREFATGIGAKSVSRAEIVQMRAQLAAKIVKIENDERNRQLAAVRKHQTAMEKAYREMYGEFTAIMERSGIRMTKQEEVRDGYLNELKKDIQDLEKQYKSLSEEELKSATGAEMKKALLAKKAEYKSLLEAEKVKTKKVKEEALSTYNFEIELLKARAKSVEDDLEREMSEVKAANEIKRKDAEEHINKLEALAKKGNKKAIAQLAIDRPKYNDLMLALEEQLQRELFTIIEKYDKKRKEVQKDYIDYGKQLFEQSIEDDIARSDRSFENEKSILKQKIQNRVNALEDELVINEGNIQKEAEIQAKLRNEMMDRELAVVGLTEEQKQIIRDKYRRLNEDAEIATFQKQFERSMLYVKAMQGLFTEFNGFMNALGERQLESYSKQIAGKANYDELYAQKKLDLEIQAAKREKALGIFGATIDTAAAIMRIWADKIPTAAKIPLTILAGLTGAAQIGTIIATPLPSATLSKGTKITGTKSTVSEKFHTGTYRPSTPSEEQEITRTLLTTERVLSPMQTSIFDSIIGRMQALGGSAAITQNVGVSQSIEERMIERAMTKALQAQKAPQIAWTEFENQAMRQKRLRDNAIIR